MRVRWFRCYSDIKDDPKALSLTDHEFRLWIHLLALASEEGEDGCLPAFSERGIVATLRTSAPKWRAALATFSGLHMVEGSPDSGLIIVNWCKRQYVSDDSTKRSRKHRATLQERPAQQPRNAPEYRVQSTETDPDNSSSSAGARDATQWFEAVTHRTPPNSVFREMLLNLDAAHPPECLRAVFEKASDKDDPWTYGKRVFDSCLTEGHEPRERRHATSGKPVREGSARSASGAGRSGGGVATAGLDPAWDKYADE